ncbi:hypothetical protein BGZ95_008967 [Linnemannia exigua]|uniref:Uncharacterized protein n=1 Tax=Linnemannia exigua TaxID=604196 RepID=A0AAD4H6Z9_9FUNG|nr:hypothetical protein BGZ95_008967 [Linnemannia exigua]
MIIKRLVLALVALAATSNALALPLHSRRSDEVVGADNNSNDNNSNNAPLSTTPDSPTSPTILNALLPTPPKVVAPNKDSSQQGTLPPPAANPSNDPSQQGNAALAPLSATPDSPTSPTILNTLMPSPPQVVVPNKDSAQQGTSPSPAANPSNDPSQQGNAAAASTTAALPVKDAPTVNNVQQTSNAPTANNVQPQSPETDASEGNNANAKTTTHPPPSTVAQTDSNPQGDPHTMTTPAPIVKPDPQATAAVPVSAPVTQLNAVPQDVPHPMPAFTPPPAAAVAAAVPKSEVAAVPKPEVATVLPPPQPVSEVKSTSDPKVASTPPSTETTTDVEGVNPTVPAAQEEPQPASVAQEEHLPETAPAPQAKLKQEATPATQEEPKDQTTPEPQTVPVQEKLKPEPAPAAKAKSETPLLPAIFSKPEPGAPTSSTTATQCLTLLLETQLSPTESCKKTILDDTNLIQAAELSPVGLDFMYSKENPVISTNSLRLKFSEIPGYTLSIIEAQHSVTIVYKGKDIASFSQPWAHSAIHGSTLSTAIDHADIKVLSDDAFSDFIATLITKPEANIVLKGVVDVNISVASTTGGPPKTFIVAGLQFSSPIRMDGLNNLSQKSFESSKEYLVYGESFYFTSIITFNNPSSLSMTFGSVKFDAVASKSKLQVNSAIDVFEIGTGKSSVELLLFSNVDDSMPLLNELHSSGDTITFKGTSTSSTNNILATAFSQLTFTVDFPAIPDIPPQTPSVTSDGK